MSSMRQLLRVNLLLLEKYSILVTKILICHITCKVYLLSFIIKSNDQTIHAILVYYVVKKTEHLRHVYTSYEIIHLLLRPNCSS